MTFGPSVFFAAVELPARINLEPASTTQSKATL